MPSALTLVLFVVTVEVLPLGGGVVKVTGVLPIVKLLSVTSTAVNVAVCTVFDLTVNVTTPDPFVVRGGAGEMVTPVPPVVRLIDLPGIGLPPVSCRVTVIVDVVVLSAATLPGLATTDEPLPVDGGSAVKLTTAWPGTAKLPELVSVAVSVTLLAATLECNWTTKLPLTSVVPT